MERERKRSKRDRGEVEVEVEVEGGIPKHNLNNDVEWMSDGKSSNCNC